MTVLSLLKRGWGVCVCVTLTHSFSFQSLSGKKCDWLGSFSFTWLPYPSQPLVGFITNIWDNKKEFLLDQYLQYLHKHFVKHQECNNCNFICQTISAKTFCETPKMWQFICHTSRWKLTGEGSVERVSQLQPVNLGQVFCNYNIAAEGAPTKFLFLHFKF